MDRYRPIKPVPKKYKAWHAPTTDNVCRIESRIEHIQADIAKVQRLLSNAPELAALYVRMNGAIPLLLLPNPMRLGKPKLVVDNTGRTRSRPSEPTRRGPRRKAY